VHRLSHWQLTFAEHITEMKEAQKRFHSLTTGVLTKRMIRDSGRTMILVGPQQTASR
jgi:hypothetical protein